MTDGYITQQRAAWQLDQMETWRVVRFLNRVRKNLPNAQNALNARDGRNLIDACVAVINDRMRGDLTAPLMDCRSTSR